MLKRPIPLTLTTLNDQMVLVKGGEFEMGGESGHDDSLPVHKVVLTDFLICRAQVTQALWQAIMKNNPAEFSHPQRPVENVSWYDCIEFCNELSRKQGLQPAYSIDKAHKDPGNQDTSDYQKWTISPIDDADGYRLPSEAEWEYAARGGPLWRNHLVEYAGSPNQNETAWWDRTSHDITQPVALRPSNSLGLFDLSGNVREWCFDWFSESYYKDLANEEITEHPIGPESGRYRVVRGGSWYYLNVNYLRVAYRYVNYYPDYRSFFIGLRLCRYPV